MARYTSAYSSFVTRLVEVKTLFRFALEKERIDPLGQRNEINALCRGSIVLLSGHLEGYIKDVGEIAIDSMHVKNVPRSKIVSSRFYYHISKDFLDEVKDTSDPDKIADKVFNFLQSDLTFWSRSGPFPLPVPIDQFNKGFSNPAFDKIRSYFNRFGYSDYKRDLASKLRADFLPTVNMVNHLVDIRNKIAHGDTSSTKTPAEVQDMTLTVQKYCSATDSVFASWWKTNYCCIR